MRRSGNGILVGGGALLAGALTFGVVLGKSLGGGTSAIDAAQPTPSAPQTSAEATPGTQASQGSGTVTDLTQSPAALTSSDPTLSPDVLSLAVDRAPFQEDRQRPMNPYRLPGEPDPTPRAEVPPPPPAPDFQLIGTVSGASGGWAIVRVGDGAPQMIALGESMEGYTLSNVRGERAVMASADRSLNLTVVGPSATVQAPTRNQGRGGNQGNQNTRNAQGAAAAQGGRQGGAAQTLEIPAAMMQQLQSQGINPAAILQQLQNGGNPTSCCSV